jgi:EAL domain-containing protein (putative c-di-GMP-specific phosphodiesterase class I)
MLSAHVGIVLNHAGADSVGRLMQLSGLARLRAASTGSSYEIYDPAMQDQARDRLRREMELRRAVERAEFTLHYQPIVSLESGRIVQAEALIRWRHPERGLVAAGEFIGLAEETGIAIPIGWFTLQEATRQLANWRSTLPTNGSLAVSVNVTAAHFKQQNVVEQVSTVLRNAQLAGTGINLEVTERLLIGNPTKAIATIAELRQLGVGIHLDDFGTGYSSLQYLHELSFDANKIDRSFIARLRNGGRDAQIVSTIRELARQLGVPVIAEGVETDEHLTLVRALGCEFAQGYLFARPMPPAELAQLIGKAPVW